MIDIFLKDIKKWAKKEELIESIIVVGSYARGTYKVTSDIDLIIITSDKEKMLKNQTFVDLFGEIKKSQIEYYGACTSIRVWYKDGKEVEFGIVSTSWIEKPLDKGTIKVLRDGFRVVIDKKGYFKNIMKKSNRQYIKDEIKTYMLEGMSIGMCIGTSLGVIIGVFIENIPICMIFGISIGLCLGFGIGSLIKR